MCAPVVVSSKPTGTRTAAIWRKPGVQGGRGELPGWVESRTSWVSSSMTPSRRLRPSGRHRKLPGSPPNQDRERELIRAREGRARAKARGVNLGRKPKLTVDQKREST